MIISDIQRDYLVDIINKKVNLPILGEKAEGYIFRKAIDKIVDKIEAEIPKELLVYVNDISNGLLPGGDGDLSESKQALVRLLNKEINLPLMSEKKEEKLFTTVVDKIFEAMLKGKKLAA